MQLTLPFSDPLAPPGSAALWIIGCPDDVAAVLQRRLTRRRHVFVDSANGATVVSPDDFILLPSRSGAGYDLLGPSDLGEETLSRFRRERLSAIGAIGPVRSLLCFALGEPGLVEGPPPRDGTRLERLIATLRHEMLSGAPNARATQSLAVRSMIEASADHAVLALLDREAADALRSLIDPAQATAEERLHAWSVHCRGEREFFAAGLSRQAMRLRSLLEDWYAGDQFRLPIPPSRTVMAAPAKRIAYQSCRAVALRFPLQSLPARSAGAAGQRRRIANSAITDQMLCRWLKRLQSPRLRPWHYWLPATSPGELKLRAGLDADLAVLMGVAGRTGRKMGRYTLRAWGEGCDIYPSVVERSVGEGANLTVRPRPGAPFDIDIVLATQAGWRIPLRLSSVGKHGEIRLSDGAG